MSENRTSLFGPIVPALVLLVVLVLASLTIGAESVSLVRAWNEVDGIDRAVVLGARLPRVLLAAFAGGGLSIVGAAFQATMRNPLAEPFVLGVSGGAALGASIALVVGIGASSMLGAGVLPLAAMMGGLGATALVYMVGRSSPTRSSASFLLAGVMVNSLSSALITLLKTVVSASKAQELLFWLTGFVDVPSTPALVAVAVYVMLGGVVLMYDAGRMNLLALGDDAATSLGVDVVAMQRRVFFAASAIVGAIVSVTGLIGFVGLVVPHAIRRLVGPDHRRLLPLSLVLGAATLVACDLLARLLFRVLGTEPPVGAITAILGAPVFLVLLRSVR